MCHTSSSPFLLFVPSTVMSFLSPFSFFSLFVLLPKFVVHSNHPSPTVWIIPTLHQETVENHTETEIRKIVIFGFGCDKGGTFIKEDTSNFDHRSQVSFSFFEITHVICIISWKHKSVIDVQSAIRGREQSCITFSENALSGMGSAVFFWVRQH